MLTGFVDHLENFSDDVHLLLVGPDVSGVSDDPEGAQVLEECRALRGSLSATARARAHLCCLPMDDVDENAHLVNALQRYAEVVVQKSLVEGFGLTVTEGMWKAKPVVASRVGGIQDQIVDGDTGVLVEPTDLKGFGEAVVRLLAAPDEAAAMGERARAHVRNRFLGPRHLAQYVDLFEQQLSAREMRR